MARKALWQNGLLLALSCGVSLLVTEAIVATFFPQNLGTWGMTRDGITSHVPNLSVYLKQFGQQITINSFGMRDREHDLHKVAGTRRILVLGDSFMEANQVAFEESFVSLIEANLRSRLPRQIEAINASVSGWGTDDELTYLVRYGLQFEPDIVLVGMTLHNDIQDNLREEFHSFEDGELHARPISPVPAFEYATLQVKEFLASHSHLYQLFQRGMRFSWMQGESNRLNSHVVGLLMRDVNPEIRRGWEMTQLLFRQIKKEADRHGAKTVVFLIPLWIQVSEERLKSFLDDNHVSADQIVLNQLQSNMKLIGSSEGVEVIDLLPDFQKWEKDHPRTLYLLEGHWTAAGHRLAAEKAADHLVSAGMFKAR